LKRTGERPSRRGRKPPRRPPRKNSRLAPATPLVATIEIDGPLDSHALQAIQLELRRLAQSCGLDVQGIDVRTDRKR